MIDLEKRINSTPRNILIARVKAQEIYDQNTQDPQGLKRDKEVLDFLQLTPGETFGEIRENIQENPAYINSLKKLGHTILAKVLPADRQPDPDPCLKSTPAKLLHDLTDHALGVPLLESALRNIQEHPESSEAKFHIDFIKGGGDRILQGISGGTPGYVAYKDVFPVVNEWLIAK